MRAKTIIDLALSQVGTAEAPPGSNNVIYNTEYYGHAVKGSNYAWCCVFIWWLFNKLGAPELFYGGGKIASCTMLYRYYMLRGQIVSAPYQPGDVVFYDWDGSGDCDHVGIVAAVSGADLKVVEGNTAIGNDANGGAVMLRSRPAAQVKGAWRPNYEPEMQFTPGDVIAALSDRDAYALMCKAQRYASTLPAPAWSAPELASASAAGITDASTPQALCTRAEAAIMALRAQNLQR